MGGQNLQLTTGTYRNASGESFAPTTFNYFVSNTKLIRADGAAYVMLQDSSYFLIKEPVPASQTITLANVPAGSCSSVSFVPSADSLRSTMDISRQTGVLNPVGDYTSASGMHWSWNLGYIFQKLEGTRPSPRNCPCLKTNRPASPGTPAQPTAGTVPQTVDVTPRPIARTAVRGFLS